MTEQLSNGSIAVIGVNVIIMVIQGNRETGMELSCPSP